MKPIKILFAFVFLGTLSFSCKKETSPEVKTVAIETIQPQTKTADPNVTYTKAEFTIEGMTCAIGCAKTIEKKLSHLDGIKSATVNFEHKLAMVEYDQTKINPAKLEETVTKAGEMYTVTNLKTVTEFTSN